MYKIIGADGKEYGPVTADQLRQWIREGRANAQTKAQAEGSSEWKTLDQFPEFAASSPSVPPPAGAQPRPQVRNYLVPAILCTIFCCLPLGIPAIVFAAQVNSKLQAGDVPGALESSRKAKMWCWLAFWLGLIPTVVWMIIFGIGGLHRGLRGW